MEANRGAQDHSCRALVQQRVYARSARPPAPTPQRSRNYWHTKGPKPPGNADILDAEQAPLRPWIATLKPIYVRVIAMEITGRRFKFGPEPDHETIIG